MLLAATHPLPLSSLNGTNGFRLDGVGVDDRSGYSVSDVGDVNADGFDDIIIGAYQAASDSGETYVVFGRSGAFMSSIDLSALNGINGFRIDGSDPVGRSGRSVGGAGDVNGDGIDDLLIGAEIGASGAGSSYLVFGKTGSFTSVIDLSALNGTNGFRIDGIDLSDRSGFSIAIAGDINGDGFDDLIIGAYRGDPGVDSDAGESYVVFGRSNTFPPSVDLSALDGATGFRIDGRDSNDWSGFSVSGAGDVNGDSFDDLIVGAFLGDDGAADSGESYVVFGKSGSFSPAMDLATLNGTNGFRIDGTDMNDWSGFSVSGAGDVNSDGIDDLIIGATLGDSGAGDSGESYVVFGTSGSFGSVMDLSTLNGTNGFLIAGINAFDRSGSSVSAAGDVNGDGIDDLIIGAPNAEDPAGGLDEGESYVVFGQSGGFGAVLDLSALNGTNGFQVLGIDAGDRSGRSVSSAGDVNGDGFDDVVIGAYLADADGNSNAGDSYLIFGGNFTGGIETQVGTDAGETLTAAQGAGAVDILIGGRGDDTLISDGGPDVLRGGEGNDVLAIPDVDFSSTRRLLGGNGIDTLRLDGSGLTLDLTAIADNRIVDIEEIDLGTASGNTLVVSALEVRNLSSHSNTLTVRGTGGTVQFADGNWSTPVSVTLGGTNFLQYTNGSAVLNVQSGLATGISVITLATLNGNDGFRLDGIDALDFSGYSVSSAGDVNGDGFDDLIIGADRADPGGDSGAGESYVLFGKSGGFGSAVDLSTLDGTTGFRLRNHPCRSLPIVGTI